MELLCPNCQQKLTVPEQYAGPLTKSPLCGGTFNTPALPPVPGPAYVPPAVPVPPPAGTAAPAAELDLSAFDLGSRPPAVPDQGPPQREGSAAPPPPAP